MKDLTRRQDEVWKWIVNFWKKYDNIPTMRQIQAAFRWGSQTSAVEYVDRLIVRGYLRKTRVPTAGGYSRVLSFSEEAKQDIINAMVNELS